MPVNGYFAYSTVTVSIDETNAWAHDLVVKAMQVWNQAQLWFQETQTGPMFEFVEDPSGMVRVEFSLPPAYADFASWTEYEYQERDQIVGAKVYFDAANTFNPDNENYAYRLALHELGHVLGLGIVLGTTDIMDARQFQSANLQPEISTLDLYAIQAQAPKFTFVNLPSDISYNQLPVSQFEDQIDTQQDTTEE